MVVIMRKGKLVRNRVLEIVKFSIYKLVIVFILVNCKMM